MHTLRKYKPEWWLWLSLLGLKAPVAAMIWAFAFFRVFHMVRDIYWAYQFLFVAVWCTLMCGRLICVVRGDRFIGNDPRLLFVKRNFVWISLFALVSVICGLWIILFHVGVGMIAFAWFPLGLSLAYLIIKVVNKAENSNSFLTSLEYFCAAGAFAFGVAIPAYFYGMANAVINFFLYSPIWYLTAFVYLAFMYRNRWLRASQDEDAEEESGIGLSACVLVLLFFCLLSAWKIDRVAETWFFFSLGIGVAGLYLLEKFLKNKINVNTLCLLGWLAMIAPAIFISILLTSVY